MNFEGLAVGFAAFLLIGAFHPLVVKLELKFGQKPKPVFAIVGIACIAASFFVHYLLSIFLGSLGFACLWTVFEIAEQRKRRLRN